MGPAASAATHSRSSLRFLTPSTTVAGPSMDNAYWWAKNAGDWPTKVLDDGWTAVTRDRSLSAQFEHTLAVTEDGYEIFTKSPKGWDCPPYE